MTDDDSRRPDLFKQAQLRYRRDASKPEGSLDDLADLVDFGRAANNNNDARIREAWSPKQGMSSDNGDSDSSDCDRDSYQGPLYTLEGHDGFLYAPQALPMGVQLQLAYSAVSSYCERPHKTNIDLVEPRAFETDNSDMSMWELWKWENGFPSRLADNGGVGSSPALPKLGKDRPRFYKSFAKLSWATMGYNYDWTARAYHDDDRSPVPTDLAHLAQFFASTESLYRSSTCSRSKQNENDAPREDASADAKCPGSFQPSACIVNYYNSRSLMGGHRDDAEFAVHQPIVSFSAGRPAVFLLGGPTRNDPVTPLVVRPGDVMMMGGPSRLCYHAMARLLPPEGLPPADAVRSEEGRASRVPQLNASVPVSETAALRSFLGSHRINVNLRQVYP